MDLLQIPCFSTDAIAVVNNIESRLLKQLGKNVWDFFK